MKLFRPAVKRLLLSNSFFPIDKYLIVLTNNDSGFIQSKFFEIFCSQ
jgi:hypothetical protein